jgi:two-component system, NarL family, response regulator LiaR
MEERKPLRFLIVDDHDLLRMGLAVFLETIEQVVVVGEAATGVEAVQLAEQLQPDIILMDIQMPVMDGITATQRIKQVYPDIHILILSNDLSDEQHQAAVEAGASAFLRKSLPIDQLAQAIQAIREPTR